jgi:uncharacterized repeat protein (TIGR01451 family)
MNGTAEPGSSSAFEIRFESGTAQTPVLNITSSHIGSFYPGQFSASYAVLVSNGANAGSSNGTVTVLDILPSGLSLISMAGNGWNCAANSCTRSDALAGGTSYPQLP